MAKNSELRYKRHVSSYSGYFTPRGYVMAYEFRSVSGRIRMLCGLFVIV